MGAFSRFSVFGFRFLVFGFLRALAHCSICSAVLIKAILVLHHYFRIPLPFKSALLYIQDLRGVICFKLAALTITMVFLAEETIPVPTKDILSWIFDDAPYDQHKPVCDAPTAVSNRQLNIYPDLC